jgi:hypothetical protein
VYTAQKIDEVKMKVIDGVKSTEDLNVLLRVGWGAETTNRMSFKPVDDLMVGDELCVTLEKLEKVVEEPKPEAIDKAAEAAEVTGTQETAEEAAPAVESEAETACTCACTCAAETAAEPVAEEKKEEEPPVDKIGEVTGVVATNVVQSNNPRLLFRVIYKKKTDEAPLTLGESLKPNDKIKVTIIRTLKAPEPEPAEGAAPAQG